jgi:histidinol phosphatase-like PHP family hydrolase/predicted MPP superfamily phosphohydrolase
VLDLVIIADVHYVDQADHICPIPKRNASLGSELIQRVRQRIQRTGLPDVIVLMGDLVDNGDAPGAEQDLTALKAELDDIGIPVLVVPGNHDGDPERLLRLFGDHPGLHEINGVLLMTFADRYAPDDRAARSPEGLALIRETASAHPDAPLLVFQHNPIHPPVESSYPYNLTNAPEVMKSYAEHGVVLSVSGHLHGGSPLCFSDHVGYVTCPALCEAPFRYLRVRVRGHELAVREESLKMSEAPPLVDSHVHTEYAYCASTVTAVDAIERAEKFGLSGITLTEHAGQLYVSSEDYWGARFLNEPELLRWSRAEGQDRMRAYRAGMQALRSSFVRIGLEVECDRNGELALLDEDRAGWDLLIGAVHFLPETFEGDTERGFMALTEKLLQQKVAVLAHPFRYFRRQGMDIPRHLFRPMAHLLAKYGVAAEINFHTNEPDPDFFRCCIEEGVPIALGSDSHALYEVGEFAPHLDVLRRAGAAERLENVLFSR